MTDSNYAFIGGDLRQFYMAEQFVSLGFPVAVYGLKSVRPLEQTVLYPSLEAIMSDSEYLICPVPFTADNILLFAKQDLPDLDVTHFISCLKKHHKIFGGNFNSQLTQYCDQNDIYYFDLLKQEEVTVKNAIATAEGTIAEAIKSSPNNLHNSGCLVLGFGRCGKILADRLRGLRGKVCVCARDKAQLALAEAYGFRALPLHCLKENISAFDFIFNTIPAPVLDAESLKPVKKSAVIIDIASGSGGTDFDACRERGIFAAHCLSLPGIYAPRSSALILNSVILEQLPRSEQDNFLLKT